MDKKERPIIEKVQKPQNEFQSHIFSIDPKKLNSFYSSGKLKNRRLSMEQERKTENTNQKPKPDSRQTLLFYSQKSSFIPDINGQKGCNNLTNEPTNAICKAILDQIKIEESEFESQKRRLFDIIYENELKIKSLSKKTTIERIKIIKFEEKMLQNNHRLAFSKLSQQNLRLLKEIKQSKINN